MNETYWRSLGELRDDPQYRQHLEREFPEGASELPPGVTRREMLLLMGSSLSLAGLTGCRRPASAIVPYVDAPEEIIPGVPRRYATTMPFGRSAYGVVVDSHEGRPTKIEGNELHPTTQGRSSVRIQGAILGLYDPDRGRTILQGADTKTWADFVAAWGALDAVHVADGGAGLAVLTDSFASPTRSRLAAAFRTRFPRARFVTYEPVSDEPVLEGVKAATGTALQPELRLDKAAVILTIEADIFGNDAEDVAQIRQFAAGRRSAIDGGAMNRLWAVEAAYSLTGAMADHRMRLPGSFAGLFLGALASRLGLGGSGPSVDMDARWLDALAKDLGANRGRCLIVAGAKLPASVHAAVLAMNAALGNVGSTVVYREPLDAALPSRSALTSLVAEMGAGSISTLVVLGGNPTYDAPADLDFAAAMGKVKNKIVLATHRDETAQQADWYIPRSHFLETWDDARAIDGTASVVQPLILPLFDSHGATEVLGLLTTGKELPALDAVRETWKPILGAADFERRWNRVLHDGLLADSHAPTVNPSISSAAIAGLNGVSITGFGGGGSVEVHFRPSPYVHDGRFANDGWFQELPDAVTKLTWENPALLSPSTASSLGVDDEGMVTITLRGKSLTLPAAIVPGQADGTVILTLGYGRKLEGRIASGVGVNAYAIRSATAPDIDSGTIARAEGRSLFASTQEHGSMEGRPLFREGTLEEFHHNPEFAREVAELPEPPVSMWKEKPYDTGHQWGMTIDLNSCVGCNACVIACQSENNIPIVGKQQVRNSREMHWIRIDRYFSGPTEDPRMVVQPVPCMQCENAPCEQVCPVAATVHDDEGLNVMVYNRCIGTRYCSNNCPYKVRRFNFFNYTKDTPEILKLVQNPDVTVRSRGVMEKCTYCTQRINAGKLDAKMAGRTLADGDIKTACQQACPANAIEFGDLRDAGSRIAKAKSDPRNYAVLEELNTKPRTTYLARVRNPHPDLAQA